jgi:4'-phosphopantetheinyl transferase
MPTYDPDDRQVSVIWSAPPATLQLSVNDIAVWRADLECDPTALKKYEATLSLDERMRAHRFHFVRDRNRFIVGRGILRMLLGAYVNRDAGELEFDYGVRGKPSLLKKLNAPAITFNLSHSQGRAVYAFGVQRQLGIDLESIRADIAIDEIAKRHFSRNEKEALLALPPHMRSPGFFLCWTRKEAYIKARGEGLQIPLDSFDVCLTPGQPSAFLRGVDENWQLLTFCLEACPVALVFDGGPANIRYYGAPPSSVVSS